MGFKIYANVPRLASWIPNPTGGVRFPRRMPSVLSVVGDTSAFQAEMIGSIPIGRSNINATCPLRVLGGETTS